MKKEKLLTICDPKKVFRGNFIWIYWTSEAYGFGKIIRQYGYYPSFFPLAICTDHSGPDFNEVPYFHEKEANAPYFLTHRKLKAENYINETNKKADVLFSPSVYFRRSNSIEQKKNANGTTCFPVHSLPGYGYEFDIDTYCNSLRKLPSNFHPIRICLHMHDIDNGSFEKYIDNGFEVVTAGNVSDQRFQKRLYKIISNSKFITSNEISTITFLSVEIRIPFFLYGVKPTVIILSANEDYQKGIIQEPEHPQYSFLKKKLTIRDDFILEAYDDKTIKMVEDILGLNCGVSRKKMTYILYSALFLWIIKLKWISFLKTKLIR